MRFRPAVWLIACVWGLCPNTASAATASRTLEAPRPGVSGTLARALGEWEAGAQVLRSIAIDIDRDGDLDVIASTREAPVAVWLNDGFGHLTPARPRPSAWLRRGSDLMESAV